MRFATLGAQGRGVAALPAKAAELFALCAEQVGSARLGMLGTDVRVRVRARSHAHTHALARTHVQRASMRACVHAHEPLHYTHARARRGVPRRCAS